MELKCEEVDLVWSIGVGMKRYLIFAYPCYYPSGGMCDLHSQFDNKDEALTRAKELIDDYVEVYDIQEDREIWSN